MVNYDLESNRDRLSEIAQSGGVAALYDEVYTIQDTIRETGMTYYTVNDADEVSFRGVVQTVRPDAAGNPNKILVPMDADDKLKGKELTPFDLLRLVHFVTKVTGDEKKANGRDAAKYAASLPIICEFKEETQAWKYSLTRGRDGRVESCIFNITQIMSNDPYFDDLIYNDWTNNYEWKGEKVEGYEIIEFLRYITEKYDVAKVTKNVIFDSLDYFKKTKHYDPLVDYLEECYKDYGTSGTEEMDHYMQEYMGCLDEPYTTEVGRLLLVGCVARAYKPGCKFDTMFILQSLKQGLGKSTLIAKLGAGFGTDNFSVDGFESKGNKELMREGAWLSEIPEMSGLNKVNENLLKSVLSLTEDRFRPAYGREVLTIKRRTVFVGTMNNPSNLFTDIKNRRFIVLRCDQVPQTKFSYDVDSLGEEEVRKLWGQAVALYKSGAYDKTGLVLSPESEQIAEAICESLVHHDQGLGQLDDFLRMPRPANWYDLSPSDRARRFVNFEANPEEKLGEYVERITIYEIATEMLGREMSELVGTNQRIVNQIEKELIRLDYKMDSSVVPIKGYGKAVKVYVRDTKKRHRKEKSEKVNKEAEKKFLQAIESEGEHMD